MKDKDVAKKDMVEKNVDEEQFTDSDASQDVDGDPTGSSNEKEASNVPEKTTNEETGEQQKNSCSEEDSDAPSKEQHNNRENSGGIVLPEDVW